MAAVPVAVAAAGSTGEEHTTRPGLALVVIMCVQLMNVLDVTVVNVALPTIYRRMGFSLDSIEWLIAAYAVTAGGMLIFGGRAGDLYGRRRVFMAGIAVFALASLLAGWAPSPLWLILARGAQGVGAAISSPTALSLLAANCPQGPERDRAVGIWAGVSAAGGAVGLLIGGLLTTYGSWRWIFFVNVPLSAFALILAPRVLNESRTATVKMDLPGAVTLTAGMISAVYGLLNAPAHGWANPRTYGPILAALALLGTFAVVQRSHPHPLIPRGLLADRNRLSAYMFMLVLATSIFSVSYFVTLYLQDIHHYSPIRTGLAFLPMALGVLVAAFATSQVLERTGIRLPLLTGPITAIAGLAWLSRIDPATSCLQLVGPLSVFAVGLGQCFVPLTATVLADLDDQTTGIASALLSTAQQLGGAIGLAALGTLAATTTRNSLPPTHHLATPTELAAAITHGYSIAIATAAGLLTIALALSVASVRDTATTG